MPFKAGKPPRSPHDWLCRFCVTSSGNPYRNNGFRRECHRCHLAKGEAFKATSEKREPTANLTNESAKVTALEKELERYRQAEKKSDEFAQQETDAPTMAAYKMAIKAFGQLQTAGLFPDDHPAIKNLRAELDQEKKEDSCRPEPDHHARERPQSGQRAGAGGRAEHCGCSEELWNSTEQRSETSRGRCRSDGTTWSSCTDKPQPKRPTELRPHSCRSCSQTESPSTCPRRRRTASKELQTSMRKSARRRQQQKRQLRDQEKRRSSLVSLDGGLDDQEDPTPDPLPRHGFRRASTSCCRLKPEVTQKDWQSCGHRWPGTSAHRCQRRNRSKGSAGRRRTPEISCDNQRELLDHARRVDGTCGAATSGAGAGTSPGGWQM